MALGLFKKDEPEETEEEFVELDQISSETKQRVNVRIEDLILEHQRLESQIVFHI